MLVGKLVTRGGGPRIDPGSGLFSGHPRPLPLLRFFSFCGKFFLCPTGPTVDSK